MSHDDRSKKFILWFEEVSNSDVGLVGGKNASLGEMYQELTKQGIKIPNGFAVTAHAYRHFLETNKLSPQIRDALHGLNKANIEDLERRGTAVRGMIMSANLPQDLIDAIVEAYKRLESLYSSNVDVAVRSSATAEDLPNASFAGQQESFLNVKGVEQLLYSCKRCMASLFTNRAISYREDKHFDHFSVALSIGVQKMVRSDKACSGVMFSMDTESGFEDVVLITGAWGLGENVVQGTVNPDETLVFKPLLKPPFRPILSKKLGSKEQKMIYAVGGTSPTKNVQTPAEDRERFCLTDDEALQLARWGCLIEGHYSAKCGKHSPMDMEWAKDGIDKELYIVQARPETVHSQRDYSVMRQCRLTATPAASSLLVKGSAVGQGIGSGHVRVIRDISGLHTFRPGEVLVTQMTDPDWEPILKKASAVITNRGGRTCHAAIISRELNIPCVVGCGNATEVLGQFAQQQSSNSSNNNSGSTDETSSVTVDCSGGEVGRVWAGKLPFVVDEISVANLPKLRTKIMLNLADPDQAFKHSFLPNSGVGLLRMEFIVSKHITAHPLALLNPRSDKVEAADREKIQQLIKGYPSGREYFIERLSQGIGTICAAFYPKTVILRFSDFKTNEYSTLLGGKHFEPTEDNPMIGWRGASRYYDERYRDGFSLECEAVKRVRDVLGLTNLWTMIPFVRTVEEAKKTVAEMEKNGLTRGTGEHAMKIISMCEIPSNVILADEFLDVFDGYSIGSNDLTQLALGVDRDSELVAPLFDERNDAVKRLISQVIAVALRKNKYIGICGQAPSDYVDFAMFLVRERIQSMSLNPDSVLRTITQLEKTEKEVFGTK